MSDSFNNHFEDFEFKPLTQGLGFHKKTTELTPEKPQFTKTLFSESKSATNEKAGDSTDRRVETVSKLIETFPSFEKSQPVFTEPLPRSPDSVPGFKSPKIHDGLGVTPVELDPALFRAPIQTPTPFEETVKNRVSHEPMPAVLKEVSFSVSAFVFDFFMVIGLAFLFTGIVLAVTKSDLMVVIANAQTDTLTRLSLVVLMLTIIQLYMTLSRSFFGKTLGEWAFDIQLGNAQQQQAIWYPLLVSWRTLLNIMTGFVVLPIFSIIVRRDVAAFLTGLRTYRVS